MSKTKGGFILGAAVVVGIVIGGYLFSQSQPRSILAIPYWEDCLGPTDLLGLVASVGIQKFPGAMPFVVLETERSVVIKYSIS
jgi:hypothetical protein